jgi:hypothetical protein
MIIGRGRVQGCQWNKGFRSSFSFSFAFSLFIFYFLILSFFSGGTSGQGLQSESGRQARLGSLDLVICIIFRVYNLVFFE